MQARFTNMPVPAGSKHYINAPAQRARVQYPNGEVKAWSGFAMLTVQARPQKVLNVTWFTPGSDDPSIMFIEQEGDTDDAIIRRTGFQFQASGLEGREAQLWPEAARLLRDPELNPAGLPFTSGSFSDSFTAFDLNFGEDGSTPTMTPVEDTLPPTLDFPYKAEIAVKASFEINGRNVKPGRYRTKAMGFKIDTGEVTHIECRGSEDKFYISGMDITLLMHQGKIDLVSVIEERMPNY